MKKAALLLSLILTMLCYFSANAELIKAQPTAEKPATSVIITAHPVSVKHHAKHKHHKKHHKHRKHKSAVVLPTTP